MTEEQIKLMIDSIKCQQPICDPYPELYGWLGHPKWDKEKHNPWRCYRDGYNQAYKEITKYFQNKYATKETNVDVPPEFEKTFRENFWKLLA